MRYFWFLLIPLVWLITRLPKRTSKLMATMLVLVAVPVGAWGATYYVSPDGNGSNPTADPSVAGWGGAYQYVNEGINAANTDGDFVVLQKVSTHTLSNHGAINKDVTILNEDGDGAYAECVITLNKQTFVSINTSNKKLTAKGFTVTGELDGNYQCVFLNSFSATTPYFKLSDINLSGVSKSDTNAGIAYFHLGGTVELERFHVENSKHNGNNTQKLITFSSVTSTLTDCTFTNNGDPATGANGQLFFTTEGPNKENPQTATITNCVFDGLSCINSAHNSGDGGAIYFYTGTKFCDFTVNIIDSTFRNNIANRGGGFHSGGVVKTGVTRCQFDNNYAYNYGGGFSVGSFLTDGGYVQVWHSLFTNNTAVNSGGGAYTASRTYMHLTNCTFANNICMTAGGGQSITAYDHDFVSGTAQISGVTNCAFSGSLGAGEYHIFDHNDGGFGIINYCSLQGGSGAIGGSTIAVNLVDDPKLTSSYRLQRGSPAINAGTDSPYSGIVYDMAGVQVTNSDGTARGGRVRGKLSIGAYEYLWPGGQSVMDLTQPGFGGPGMLDLR